VSRADRLIDLARSLAAPAGRTVSELALEFGTSERTIFRDLAALEEHDIRVERLEGGRYRVESTRNRPALDSSELAIVQLALTRGRAGGRGPIGRRIGRLMAKIDRVLGGSAEPECRRPESEAIRKTLDRAIADRRTVTLHYRSLSGTQVRVRVDPWRLLAQGGSCYLVGRAHSDDDPRLFRLERIGRVLDERGRFAEPPELDFEPLMARLEADPAEG